jgi:hypothetical protein
LRKALVSGGGKAIEKFENNIGRLTDNICVTDVFLVLVLFIAMVADWKMLFDGTSFLVSGGTAIGIATVLTLFEAGVSAFFGKPDSLGASKSQVKLLLRFFLILLIVFVVIAKSYANTSNAIGEIGVWLDHPEFGKFMLIFGLIYLGISAIEFMLGLAGAAEKSLQIGGTISIALLWFFSWTFYLIFLALPEAVGTIIHRVIEYFKGNGETDKEGEAKSDEN